MRSKLLFTLLATTMLIATALQSAEIVPIWHTESGAGDIQDMELLKGGNQFIALAGQGPEAQIQIRNTEDGELVRFYTTPISTGSKLQITPDSTRVLMINGSFGQLRLLDEQFTILKTFNIESDSIKIIFNALAIDPVRPLVYLSAYGGQYINGKYQSASKILAYNYETGEHFKDLTEFGEYEYTVINVSNNGKYFASINEGEAYLKVWDLETMKIIRNVQLYDESTSDNWCEPKDIQFENSKSDIIYFSGEFPNSSYSTNETIGIFKYSIINNIRNSDMLNRSITGKFLFFSNNKKIFVYPSQRILILDLLSYKTEYYNKPNDNVYTSGEVFYLEYENRFISYGFGGVSKFEYDSKSVINTVIVEEIIITPNPTNSFINLNTNCSNEFINYTISNQNGQYLIQNTILNTTNIIRIDFTTFPNGIYFLTLECNNLLKTYKIVKEG